MIRPPPRWIHEQLVAHGDARKEERSREWCPPGWGDPRTPEQEIPAQTRHELIPGEMNLGAARAGQDDESDGKQEAADLLHVARVGYASASESPASARSIRGPQFGSSCAQPLSKCT